MNEVKFKKNELHYVEGVTTIKNFLQSITKSVVKQKWIPLDKNETDRAWAFNRKREIILPEDFNTENQIKLYKTELGSNNQYLKKTEIDKGNYLVFQNVIKGIGNDDNGGTQINDRVLIEVTYENKKFQQVTFVENAIESGQGLPACRLKSRPQGDIELFEEEIVKIEKELLYQKGGNQFYQFGRCPISESKNSDYSLQVYRNDTLVDASEYKVDWYNGILLFNEIQTTHADKITATYGVKTGKKKNPQQALEKTKYKRHQDTLIDVTTGKELNNKDYIVEVDYYWRLHYPSKVQEIKDKVILKTNVDLSKNGDRFKLKTYYVEMKYMDFDRGNESEDYRTGIQVRFGSKLKEVGAGLSERKKGKKDLEKEQEIMETLNMEEAPTLDDDFSCEWAKWSWYKKNAFEDGVVFEDWLPIRFAINFTKEYMNIFIQGNQAPDIGEFESHYLMGHAYFGMLKNYDNTKVEDLENNFAMTVSSGEAPNLTHKRWGERTGNGITDVVMERTNSNIPYQGHNVSFYTSPEFMEKHFINYSEYTKSFHFSEITVLHNTERERGMMQGLLVGDKSALSNFDELILNKDEFDLRGVLTEDEEVLNRCGFPFKSKETKWTHIGVNSPYSFLNNSPNTVYGLAMRKE